MGGTVHPRQANRYTDNILIIPTNSCKKKHDKTVNKSVNIIRLYYIILHDISLFPMDVKDAFLRF